MQQKVVCVTNAAKAPQPPMPSVSAHVQSGDRNKVTDFHFTAQKHVQYQTPYQRDFLPFFLTRRKEKKPKFSCICSRWYPKANAIRGSVVPIPKHICSAHYFERHFDKYAEEKYIDFLDNHRSASFKKHLFLLSSQIC